jgi:tyrosine-protein kinase Etk/Wzc
VTTTAGTFAGIVGQLADVSLMELKAGVHPMREIEASVKRLRQVNVNLRGLLFNDVNAASRRYGAGNCSYQYKYYVCRSEGLWSNNAN